MTDRKRNAEILAKRMAGQSVRSIGKEYNRSRTAIHAAAAKEVQLQKIEQMHGGHSALVNIRAVKAIQELYAVDPVADPQKAADLVVAGGRRTLLKHWNVGHKAVSSIEAWLQSLGRTLPKTASDS